VSRLRLVGFAAMFVPLAIACESLIDARFDDARPEESSGADAQVDAPACSYAKPPGPPSLKETNDIAEATVVIHDVAFGDAKDSQGQPTFLGIGYDLDDNCADQGEAPLCRPAAWTKGDASDGPGGVDNAVGKMIASQEKVLGLGAPALTSAKITAAIQGGEYSPLGVIKVSKWGGFDDDRVRVEWYVALPAKLAPGFVPKFDGTDVWPLGSLAADGGGSALVAVDENAYVTGRVLVARFDHLQIPFATLFLEVNDVILTGSLSKQGERFVLEKGTLAGWSHVDEVIGLIPAITKNLFGISMCADNANFPVIKNFVCRVADMTPAGEECQGESFGIRFETVPVTLGQTYPLPHEPPCPAETDPKTSPCGVAPKG